MKGRSLAFPLALVLTLVLGLGVLDGVGKSTGFVFVQDFAYALQYAAEGVRVCYYDVDTESRTYESVGEILAGTEVVQEFEVSSEMLNYDKLAVSLYLATYARANTCTFSVALRQGDEECVVSVDAESLDDNSWKVFVFTDISWLEEGTAQIVCWSDDATSGNAVTVYASDYLLCSDSILVGDEERELNLALKMFTPLWSSL